MNYITLIVLILSTLYLILLLMIFITQIKLIKNKESINQTEWPNISILVAARNEEKNILKCVQSLNELKYPKDKIEILIGNDDSQDNTAKIIQEFIIDKPHFKLFNFNAENLSKTRGKARVLSLLIQNASSNYYLITDADITVNSLWANEMIKELTSHNHGLVAGTTMIQSNTYFGHLQRLDWLYFKGIIKLFSEINNPLTAVGNNMCISKKAYESVGGYENIPFSITEDYALFKAIRDKGFSTSQLFNSESIVYSAPVDNFKTLMNQRKRWLVGGLELPVKYKALIFLFGFWYFAVPYLAFNQFFILLFSFLIIKTNIQLFQFLFLHKQLNKKVNSILALLTYDLYLLVMIPLSSLYFFIPTKTVWKGRKY